MQEKKTGMPSETGKKSVRECLFSRNCLSFAASWVTTLTLSYSSFRIARAKEKVKWQKKNQVANATPGKAESNKKCNRLKIEKGCLRVMIIYLLHMAGSTWSHPNNRTPGHAGEMSLMSKPHFVLWIFLLTLLKKIFQRRFLSWFCNLNLGVVSSTKMTGRKRPGQTLCMWWEHQEKMESSKLGKGHLPQVRCVLLLWKETWAQF